MARSSRFMGKLKPDKMSLLLMIMPFDASEYARIERIASLDDMVAWLVVLRPECSRLVVGRRHAGRAARVLT